MRVVQINTTCGVGSTGKIAVSISRLLCREGIDNEILFSAASDGYRYGVKCGSVKGSKIQALKSRILGNYGFNSVPETRRMIRELERFSPDAILLHNIHGHDCNLALLFSYFRKKQIKLYWVFHDCWAFTGYCTYFTMNQCEKWKDRCFDCPQYRQFSWFFDRSCGLYQKKRKLFSGLDITVITPSRWLADLVKQSFMSEHPVRVIHNGIDLSVFKPTPSEFRKKYGIPEEKSILLGVALKWNNRKGLDVFIELAHRIDPDQYQIVLVGSDRTVDKQLPGTIISIHRTQSQRELAEIYTAADLFVNPTREDNYPTVNMESIACGTPVVTFETGGSPEIIDEQTGSVVECDNIDALEKEIIRIRRERPYSFENCIAKAGEFDLRFAEYLKLLKEYRQ